MRRSRRAGEGAIEITRSLLRRWPLPVPGSEGDKEQRGRLLIIAGSSEVPGAAVLAANAALRSGVGKLTVATEEPQTVAQSVPEARVVPFKVGRTPRSRAGDRGSFDAVLIGPGMEPSSALSRCVDAALAMGPHGTTVLDAGALTSDIVKRLRARDVEETPMFVLTPHAGEMAALLGISKEQVEDGADAIALNVSKHLSVVVVLKGATTRIAHANRLWCLTSNNIGLATSGSGDTLAGIISALAARGAPAIQAAVWGVALHARAGAGLRRRYGTLGALAREIPHEIPRLMNRLAGREGARNNGSMKQ